MQVNIVPGIMPDPRCIQVTAGQKLEFKNETGSAVRLQLGPFDENIPADSTQLLDATVESYLALGVHHPLVSSGSLPEIWIIEE